MPRALFISTAIPPLAESQTIRNVYLLRGLARAGFDLEVVAPSSMGGDPTLLDLLPRDIAIRRTDVPWYDQLLTGLAKLPSPFSSWTRSALALTAGYLLAPDVRRDWASKALHLAMSRTTSVPSLIVSSAGSFTAHIAASALAACWGCPWLADYGDPWSSNPLAPASLPHIRWQNARLESRALAHCAGITVTTEETAILYRKTLDARIPVDVVPCGYTPFRAPEDTDDVRASCTVAYTGSASRGTRDLRSFLRAFASVSRTSGTPLQFEVIGASSPAFRTEARRLGADNVRFTGWVSYAESLRRMATADLLLLVGNTGPLQIPAKAFNYAASGVPVLYLGQIPPATDPTFRLVSQWPGVTCATADSHDLSAVLADTLTRLPALKRAAATRPTLASLQQYEWDRVADRFAQIAMRRAGLAR